MPDGSSLGGVLVSVLGSDDMAGSSLGPGFSSVGLTAACPVEVATDGDGDAALGVPHADTTARDTATTDA
jgi:hypothetical protein